MEYKYLLEEKANLNINANTHINESIIYILCYTIQTNSLYPFLQFVMKINEQFNLLYIIISKQTNNIQQSVLNKVRKCLNATLDDENIYKGIIFEKTTNKCYALVNITNIYNNDEMLYTRNSLYWFILPSEIINNKNVCNIDINSQITKLFTDNPEIGLLTNTNTNNYYMLPDVVYTGDEISRVKFKSIFGNIKSNPYEKSGEYYYFYKQFCHSTKDGGWANGVNKNIIGGVNRYALFVDCCLYFETSEYFELTDEIIDTVYTKECIVICYTNKHYINPDMLVKKINNFICLSYHILNSDNLDDQYLETNNKYYNII